MLWSTSMPHAHWCGHVMQEFWVRWVPRFHTCHHTCNVYEQRFMYAKIFRNLRGIWDYAIGKILSCYQWLSMHMQAWSTSNKFVHMRNRCIFIYMYVYIYTYIYTRMPRLNIGTFCMWCDWYSFLVCCAESLSLSLSPVFRAHRALSKPLLLLSVLLPPAFQHLLTLVHLAG